MTSWLKGAEGAIRVAGFAFAPQDEARIGLGIGRIETSNQCAVVFRSSAAVAVSICAEQRSRQVGQGVGVERVPVAKEPDKIVDELAQGASHLTARSPVADDPLCPAV